MRPGPPPKPTAIKRLEGNPGQYPLNENEPQPKRGCVMPTWLPNGAKREWQRIYPELDRLGLVTIVDLALLAAYCVAFSQHERAVRLLKPTRKNPRPEIQQTKSGYEVPSGTELMRRNAVKELRAVSAEFGFSPAARSRIEIKESVGDELEALVSGDPN